jgi:hypothetical protein
MGALLGEPGWGLCCWGTCRLWKEGCGDGHLSSGGSVGQPGVGSSTGEFERWVKGALEVGHLSVWELCEGNLEGGSLAGELGRGPIYQGLWETDEGGSRNGVSLSEEAQCRALLYWGPGKKCSERHRIWASLSIRAPLHPRESWKQEGGSST